MELTDLQYQLIQPFLPRQRGNVTISNRQTLNAILYVAEQGCTWRGLPTHYGNWHTIYTRMNRWAKSGVLDRIFTALQQRQIIQVRGEAGSLDSSAVKVHPDGTGALKKNGPQAIGKSPSGVDHQDSSGCRRCSNGGELFLITRQCGRCAGRAGVVETDAGASDICHHGSRL